MPLVKSHSNYVLKKKHQNVSDGTIWERDMSTVGGLNNLTSGQTPIYQSGNFVISVRTDNKASNQYNSLKWLGNGGEGEGSAENNVWTLSSVSALTSDEDEQNSLKIVLKQDYYDLRDFAYYGSLTELFRASVTDILSRFPGELYISPNNQNVYYNTLTIENSERLEDTVLLGSADLKEVSNPFGIDIHTRKKPLDGNPLKYFADSGFKNYEIFFGDSQEPKEITSVTVAEDDASDGSKGSRLFTVTINGSIEIEGYVGENCKIFYLSKSEDDIHIRPKAKFLTEFYNGCDNFQKLLLDRKSTPKYTATFSIIKEDDSGYYRELEDFTFPTSSGGYNIDASTYGFTNYTARMIEVGEYYDEYFTDNLYRSMTHEAIKNFDWTYTREFNPNEEEEYVQGGERMQKALRIFAREFDEIKSYIDAIKSINKVTYDERNNIPDYFLTDFVAAEGWDVKLVYPYQGTYGNFSQNTKDTVYPYSVDGNNKDPFKQGYFITCCEIPDKSPIEEKPCGYSIFYHFYPASGFSGNMFYDECRFGGQGAMVNAIRPFTDEKEYTYTDVSNEFLRRLKINSKSIWRNKGTVDGIEMILGLFGLKSKRWVEAYNNQHECGLEDTADYEIIEYATQIEKPITETYDCVHDMYRIDWVNSTKNIVYDNRLQSNTTSYGVSTSYTPYQGLPIVYHDTVDDQNEPCRYLYPYFDKNQQIDGNPYFQMNGGWLKKKKHDVGYFQFDENDEIIAFGDETAYTETVRNIRRVDSINDLFAIPTNELSDGAIAYVSYIGDDLLIIGGIAYTIKRKYVGGSTKRYVSFVKRAGLITIGEDYFFDEQITVYDSNYEELTYTIEDKADGWQLDAYINDGSSEKFYCRTKTSDEAATDYNYGVDAYTIFESAATAADGQEYSNYFKLLDVNLSNCLYELHELTLESGETIEVRGWKRLLKSDLDYKKISAIKNYTKGNNPHNGKMSYDDGKEYFSYFEQLFKYPLENDLFDYRCFSNFSVTRDNEIKNYGFKVKNYKAESKKISYISKEDEEDYLNGKNDGNNSYLLMNNKYLTIRFYLKECNDEAAQVKYLDDIVMNYVTQMVPSTTILQVEYEKS